jgi:hypothetical protein
MTGRRFVDQLINLRSTVSPECCRVVDLIRQRGASFYPRRRKKCPGWKHTFRGGTEGMIAPEDLMQLTKSIFWFWLPRAIQDQVNVEWTKTLSGNKLAKVPVVSGLLMPVQRKECPLCLGPAYKETALYCINSFVASALLAGQNRALCPVPPTTK